MALTGSNSRLEYLRILVGRHYISGMSEWEMLYLLAGKPSMTAASYLQSDLCRLWAKTKPHPGYSSWDWIRIVIGSLFKPGDTINDMLRKYAAAHPNGVI